jgi:hypothetical protein
MGGAELEPGQLSGGYGARSDREPEAIGSQLQREPEQIGGKADRCQGSEDRSQTRCRERYGARADVLGQIGSFDHGSQCEEIIQCQDRCALSAGHAGTDAVPGTDDEVAVI